ncbi:MAG: sodium-dependent transporter [Bacteroidales bacterium]|nr:sodium-dependent transporter [Bacteroidales bacterium]MDD4821147.1 sodium-dependent transporter [Bacteroidales bacterium]
MKESKRGGFGSKIGVVLASAGSAVGLGNIWRFSYMTGQNGGAAFILIYLCCVFLLGLPVMLSEFTIGRRAHSNTMRAYLKLAPGTKWFMLGGMGVLAGFLILGYYSVVCGWTLEYLFQSVAGNMSGKEPEAFNSMFSAFTSSSFRPLMWMILFLLLTHFIVVKGIKKGIEKSSMILMPMLFIIMLVLIGRSVTLPGAREGLSYLFNPDFSKITSSVVLSALGQAFFSLSLGMGCLCTYASYFPDNTNMVKTGVEVTVLDTTVAILSGVIIFPAVFTFGIDPSSGPELVFVTLPNVFQNMIGGYLWSILFYILLTLAALTSTISMHEVVTAFMEEETRISRAKAAWIVTLGCMLIGTYCSLSFGLLGRVTVFGLDLFTLTDFISSKVMLPLGGMFISLFTGWYLDKKILWDELSNHNTLRFRLFKAYLFIIRYVAPVFIACIFLKEIGVL